MGKDDGRAASCRAPVRGVMDDVPAFRREDPRLFRPGGGKGPCIATRPLPPPGPPLSLRARLMLPAAHWGVAPDPHQGPCPWTRLRPCPKNPSPSCAAAVESISRSPSEIAQSRAAASPQLRTLADLAPQLRAATPPQGHAPKLPLARHRQRALPLRLPNVLLILRLL